MTEIKTAVDLFRERDVDITNWIDIDNWCKLLNCTTNELILATKKVGVNARNVRNYIEEKRRDNSFIS